MEDGKVMNKLNILYEDNHIIVVEKPFNVLSQADNTGDIDMLTLIKKYIKEKYPQTKIRINTNGHANYVYKRDIVPELKGLIDTISVSLNGESSSEYDELSQPVFEGAYDEVKKFIKSCSDNGFETVASVVEGYKGRHLNLDKCEQIATDLGAKFRVREWIKNGY